MSDLISKNVPNKNLLYIDLSTTKAISNLFLENNPLPQKTIIDLINSNEFNIENNLENGLIKKRENFYCITGIQKHIDKEFLEKDAFIEHFNINEALGSNTKTGAYYSYDYENTHFVMLNTNEDSKEFNNFSKEQIEWMKEDIAKAKKRGITWIIATIHKGPYTTSNHATDSDIMGENGVRTKIAPIFSELGVDLVLQGHDHGYARTKPINNGKAMESVKVKGQYNNEEIGLSIKEIKEMV